MSPIIAERYDLDLPEYPGLDQVVEVAVVESGEDGSSS